MPDAPVIEAPPKPEQPYVPPQVPESPKPKVNRGDVFRENLVKAQKEERGEAVETPQEAPSKPVEPPTETPQLPSKPEETPSKPASETPKSPLDVVTADKKPEVKAEPDVLDELESVVSPKSEDWKKLKGIAKTHRDEKKALEATVAELKKTPKSDPEEIVRLSKERDALKQSLAEREELIKSVDVRLSDDYRSLAKKRDDTVQKLASRARSYGVDADMLISALALPESKFKTDQIKAVMSEVDPDDKARITVLMEQLDGHNEALFEFEKDAPKKYEEIQAKREAALREQQEASIKTIHSEFGKITEALLTDVVTLREAPDDVPGGTEWNEAIQKAKENALRILSPGGSDFKESAAIAVKGAHYDAVMNMFLKEHSELLDARKRLAEYDGGGPDFKGGNKPAATVKATPVQKFYKALESIKGASSQDD